MASEPDCKPATIPDAPAAITDARAPGPKGSNRRRHSPAVWTRTFSRSTWSARFRRSAIHCRPPPPTVRYPGRSSHASSPRLYPATSSSTAL